MEKFRVVKQENISKIERLPAFDSYEESSLQLSSFINSLPEPEGAKDD